MCMLMNCNWCLSSELGLRGERDAIDTLFDHAPDKLNTVKKVHRNDELFHLFRKNKKGCAFTAFL